MQNLTERLEVRCSLTEKKTYQLRAKEAGMTTSEWIRRRLLVDTVRKPAPETNNAATPSQ